MDQKRLERIEERLIQVNKVIEKLDPGIRASAFELLKGYVTGEPDTHVNKTPEQPSKSSANAPDLAGLIEMHAQEKPSDNAHLLAADWYQKYGSAPFAPDSIKEAAVSAGLTIPEHLIMTFRAAQDCGKKLYHSAGRGLFRPTVTGELYLKKTYGVTKGTSLPPTVEKS